MDCNQIIKVQPLFEEAWKLFEEKLGKQLPTDIIEIAKSIAKECAGLPLGIITIASSLKGVEVDDINEWSNTLTELTVQSDMKEVVYRILKFSYDRLGDSALQMCFLCCALYPEDHKISRGTLINYLIDEGIIRESSRKAELDKGHTMLNKLERVCLLEGCLDYRGCKYVKMHDLIRDMAIQLMKADTLVCTESQEIDCESLTEDLVRILVAANSKTKIGVPSNLSLMCPKLSTLFWFDRRSMNFLKSILMDHFMEQLHGLKILHIESKSFRVLPNSVSNLSNLTTLSLRECHFLEWVPSLSELKDLKKLDLCFTRVREVPWGIEFLCDLKYLGLFQTFIRVFPSGILPKLSSLQVLLLDPCARVKVEEVASLKKLETLCCALCDSQFLVNDNVPSLEDMGFGIGRLQLNNYLLWIQPRYEIDYDEFKDEVFEFGQETESLLRKRVIVGEYKIRGCNTKVGQFKLLDVESYLAEGLLGFENDWTLELDIKWLAGIKYLFKLGSSSACECPKKIDIQYSKDMQDLFFPSAAISSSTFFFLKSFRIVECPSIKKLFPFGLLSNLRNLEEIYVWDCEELEELITADEQESHHSGHSSCSFILPKLIKFSLSYLPELKIICSRKMICTSLQVITVYKCPELKQIPMCLISSENGQATPLPTLLEIRVDSEKWWRMVKLDHGDAKEIPSPIVSYSLDSTIGS